MSCNISFQCASRLSSPGRCSCKIMLYFLFLLSYEISVAKAAVSYGQSGKACKVVMEILANVLFLCS